MAAAFDLSDRIALVTGSARGIGFALARGLGGAGAEVVLHATTEAAAAQAAERLQAEGLDCCAVAFDVRDPESVTAGIARIESEVGGIDILVNNAGIQRRKPVLDVPVETWREVIEVNLTGPFVVSQAVARHMAARRRGKIINIASLVSTLGRATITPYAASKGGLLMLTRNLAIELAPLGIQVNAIGPGYIQTELTQPLVEDAAFTRWVIGRTPAGRWGKPEDIVGTAVYLAASASDFVTGQIIYVDGGMSSSL